MAWNPASRAADTCRGSIDLGCNAAGQNSVPHWSIRMRSRILATARWVCSPHSGVHELLLRTQPVVSLQRAGMTSRCLCTAGRVWWSSLSRTTDSASRWTLCSRGPASGTAPQPSASSLADTTLHGPEVQHRQQGSWLCSFRDIAPRELLPRSRPWSAGASRLCSRALKMSSCSRPDLPLTQSEEPPGLRVPRGTPSGNSSGRLP